MKYISSQDILIIHNEIINSTGGSHGIRDTNLLISISERPKSSFAGKELHKGVFIKAATYLESLVNYHVFIDGNKRTGIACTTRFLFINNFIFNASNKDIEKFVVRIATDKLSLEEIAKWIKKHSTKSV